VERLRVFIAIDVDDPLLVSVIDRVRDMIVATGVPMKPVESQNYHITLRFIGEVPLGVIEEIKRVALSTLEFSEFKLTLRGLGAFPDTARPRVVWVGVSDGLEELKAMREHIERALRRIGIPPEREKEFKPHLTLARIKGSRNIHALARILAEYEDYEFGSMRVRSVRLKKSTLTRSGPIYETLWEVKAS